MSNQQKKIYQVGGCVRDKLMGIKSDDIDLVAVGYSCDDFSHLQQVGKDFPVFLTKQNHQLALARTEKKVAKGYNGFVCETKNITLKEDLQRRDLTINSIAYDPIKKQYIDPFGGINDIANKVLKHTSKAFCEDPLRVLRLARFQAKFPDFKIDNSTKELVKQLKNELQYLQPNRVYLEVKKAMLLPNSWLFFVTLYQLEVLDAIFPNLYRLTLDYQDKNNTSFYYAMKLLKYLKNSNIILKYTALFYNISSPKTSIDILLPSKIKKQILLLIQNHTQIDNTKNLTLNQLVQLIQSYKRNRQLFIYQLIFARAKYNTISKSTNALPNKILLEVFDKIVAYSPKQWLDNLDTKVSNEEIKEYIQNQYILIVKNIKY